MSGKEESVFKLRKVIHAHTGDVRCLDSYLDGFVSGSRDTTAKIWLPCRDCDGNGSSDRNGFSDITTFLGPTHYVSSIVSARLSSGQIVVHVGSNDGNIYSYTEEKREPESVLKSHQGTVCSLAVSSRGQLLSGSWDTTGRLWQGREGEGENEREKGKKSSICLEGHTAAVWTVSFLSDSSPLTGSADKSIRQWSLSGSCVRTFSGHSDVVRGIAVLNESTFLSVSNDASVRQWTSSTPDPVLSFHGHENYIYDIVILPPAIDGSFRFLTCSEDRTARVWIRDRVFQTIRLPATTLWSVCSLSDGDIAIGASNGAVYVYTTNQGMYNNFRRLALISPFSSYGSV